MNSGLALIVLATSVLGVASMFALVGLCVAAYRRGHVGRFRSKREGVADLLDYGGLIDDGIVLLKSGGLLAGYTYRVADAGGSTAEEQNALCDSLSRALLPLGSGWMLHVDAVRQPIAAYCGRGGFPDVVSAAIDDERRRFFTRQGTAYEGHCVLTITYTPPMRTRARMRALLFDDQDPASKGRVKEGDRHLLVFRRELRAFETRLPFHLERLRARTAPTEAGAVVHDELLRWLHYCATGLSHPIASPKSGVYLDRVIGGQDLEFVGEDVKVGQRWLQVVAIDGFPRATFPGLLNQLAELPCEYRWSTRAIFVESHEAVKHLERYRRKWQQKIRGFVDQVLDSQRGPIDRHAMDMVGDAEAAISTLSSGEVGPAYYTSVVVLLDEDLERVRRAAHATARAIRRLGFSAARIEDLNLVDAFLGSLPGHGIPNVRRPLLNTLDVADLLPTTSIWAGSEYAPCPYYPSESPPLMYCLTGGSTPFRFNLHQGDVGHTLMFGPTGAGKSTHLAVIAAQLRRYEGMRVFAFDKGMSLFPLASAIHSATGGRSGFHFDLNLDTESCRFAPLAVLDTEADRKWAMEWVDLILAMHGVKTTPAQRVELGTAVVNMHRTGARTMSELVLTLQDLEMSEVLRQYTSDAPMGRVMDAEEDFVRLSDFTVFEIEDLLSAGDKLGLPVLTYLFRRIERSLQGAPAAILLDEAWVMLGHPVFREKIREWLKVLRKANCLVLLATQSVTDASRSGILDVLVESCPTKLFLPNPNARSKEGRELYQSLGLNERQIELVASGTAKRDYYYVSGQGRRMYELALGPLALALCGSSSKDDIGRIRALQCEQGAGWLRAWLTLHGVPKAHFPGGI